MLPSHWPHVTHTSRIAQLCCAAGITKNSWVHVLAEVLNSIWKRTLDCCLQPKTRTHSNLHACPKGTLQALSVIAMMMLSVVEGVYFSYNTRSHIVHLFCRGSSQVDWLEGLHPMYAVLPILSLEAPLSPGPICTM